MVLIINADLYLSALSRQGIGLDLLSVQIVSDLYGNRQRGVCLALVIDIIASGGPGDGAVAVFGKAFVAFYIFDILQIAVVGQRGVFGTVFQPVADDDLLGGAVLIGGYIDGLLFSAAAASTVVAGRDTERVRAIAAIMACTYFLFMIIFLLLSLF